jgi:hypothetical protein
MVFEMMKLKATRNIRCRADELDQVDNDRLWQCVFSHFLDVIGPDHGSYIYVLEARDGW